MLSVDSMGQSGEPSKGLSREHPSFHSELSWQKQLAAGFQNPYELLAYLGIDPHSMDVSDAAHQSFKTRVPEAFAAKMVYGDREDPLLRQVLPLSNETIEVAGYVNDPLHEAEANPVHGLLHKYPSRVLLTLTGGCAVNCRYCFRRHFDYQTNTTGRDGLTAMLAYIRSKKEIKEVILSGGDPLLVSDNVLETIVEGIEELRSVEILRIHTRMPIVLPARVTPGLLNLLKKTSLKTVCVVHCNHPNEIDNSVRQCLLAMRDAGTHVLNQSVLLKGVNDDPETLCQLSYALLNAGVLPYYLHVLDKVQGAAHFDLNDKEALAIHHAMRKKLPGYLLPRLVREVAGELSKMPIY